MKENSRKEYRNAVLQLVEPSDPDLTLPFLLYKQAVEGRNPLPTEFYLYGVFDGLVHWLEDKPTVLLPRYNEDSLESLSYLAGIDESDQIYDRFFIRTFQISVSLEDA